MGDSSTRLKITEVFYSLQGEAKTIGYPTVFIRLTGCPLRCQYCDTAYAFHGGEWREIDELVTQAKQYATSHVTVTGGEPLAQKNCIPLLEQLCDAGLTVSLETSGAMDISAVDARVSRVVDIKTPDSLEAEKNRWENLALLTPQDQIKFVLCSRQDYEWSKQIIAEHELMGKCELLFSPSFEKVEPRELAEWIIADQLPVRFQIQLHKQLWGDQEGV